MYGGGGLNRQPQGITWAKELGLEAACSSRPPDRAAAGVLGPDSGKVFLPASTLRTKAAGREAELEAVWAPPGLLPT